MRRQIVGVGQRLVDILLDIGENGPTLARHVVFAEELVAR
jgi:hypothetical protein